MNQILSRLTASILILTLCLLAGFLISAQMNLGPSNSWSVRHSKNEKHKGAHIFGYLDTNNIQDILDKNINWITMVPFGYQKDYNSGEVKYYRRSKARRDRRDSMWMAQAEFAKENGIKFMFKPHIWIDDPSEGKWRADIFPQNEEDWTTWQEGYREFILHYARIAQKSEMDLFCVGTELTRISTERPEFWIELIRDVRKVYHGKLTYAANWYKEYENVSFWDELDYIGIQAYFPLANNENPSVAEISKGWQKYLPKLEKISKQYDRKILFTEMGYKSTSDSAIKPWEWVDEPGHGKSHCAETQANCYRSFFESVWDRDWFAGVHIWQMRPRYENRDLKNNMDFTPQGKPAAKVITEGFEK